MKKVWKKPELVILVRARPEESVLSACKHPNQPGEGPSTNYAGDCKLAGENCATCSKTGET